MTDAEIEAKRQRFTAEPHNRGAFFEDMAAEVRRLRAALRELDACFCDDRDGNCNPPHNSECDRCKRIREALQ